MYCIISIPGKVTESFPQNSVMSDNYSPGLYKALFYALQQKVIMNTCWNIMQILLS